MAIDEARARLAWMAPAGALLLAAAAGLAGLRTRAVRRTPPSGASEPVPPLDVEVRANVDAGDAHGQPDEARAVRREVRLQLVVDRGSQELSAVAGDFVRGERREQTPGAPPPEDAS